MTILISLGFISLAASLLLTPLFRGLALRLGLVDLPDNNRKLHPYPVPRIGGIPIALSCVIAFSAVAFIPGGADAQIHSLLATTWSLIPATLLIFLVGLADDLFGLKPTQKLAGELLAAIVAAASGVQIHSIAGLAVPSWVAIPLTVGWLVACANALNLVDGLDGLATGIGLFATATTLVAALLDRHLALAIATVPLAGALIGFLRYNFNPASIFLGDSGSLMLGFLLGCFAVLWAEKSATILGMTAPLIALAVPLLDTGLAIARRTLRRQPIFGADRSHIHHRLLARGLKPRRAALMLYLAAGIASALSLLLGRLRGEWDGIIILLFAACAIAGIEHLGYAEFKTARELATNGAFWRAMHAQLAIQAIEDGLGQAATADECWDVIKSSSRDFGLHRIRMHLAGRNFEWHSGTEAGRCWAARIPISAVDWIELSHQIGSASPATVVEPFADAVHRALHAKVGVIETCKAQAAAVGWRSGERGEALVERADRSEIPREKVNGGNGISHRSGGYNAELPDLPWFDNPQQLE